MIPGLEITLVKSVVGYDERQSFRLPLSQIIS